MSLALLQCDDQVDLMGIVGRMSASPILLVPQTPVSPAGRQSLGWE